MATILSIIPYQFYPPQSGGALRCFYLLNEISKEHFVYVLTVQPEQDFYKDGQYIFSNNVVVISLFGCKEYVSFFNFLPQKLARALNYRWIKKSLTGSSNTLLLRAYPAVMQLLSTVALDMVYYESLEALHLFNGLIRKKNRSIKHLYDAHNVDSNLWLQQYELTHNKQFLQYSKQALSIERQLFNIVDAYICCSEIDNQQLSALNNNKIKGTVVPNGVDVSKRPFDSSSSKSELKNLLFCGSLDYYPNKQGLLWFYRNVFPKVKAKVPDINLIVIGRGDTSEYDELKSDASVSLIGEVEDVVPYYLNASIALVPILSGSGTRLKILEAMSLGNPVISTSVGCEGLMVETGKHIIIANDPQHFTEEVISVVFDNEKFNQLRKTAYKMVLQHYNWTVIGISLNKKLRTLIA